MDSMKGSEAQRLLEIWRSTSTLLHCLYTTADGAVNCTMRVQSLTGSILQLGHEHAEVMLDLANAVFRYEDVDKSPRAIREHSTRKYSCLLEIAFASSSNKVALFETREPGGGVSKS
jgi:hypothetical protein